MPQNVPSFEFSDAAKQLRQFVYEHWCEHGRGPNLRAVHEGTGLDRRQIVQGYKELQLGIICVVDQDSVNGNLLKFQPFSSFPSQVEVWIDGAFHSYAGCALESVAISKMPPFQGKDLTPQELLRLLPRPRGAHRARGRGRRRPTAPWSTSAPPRGTGTTTTSSTSATR